MIYNKIPGYKLFQYLRYRIKYNKKASIGFNVSISKESFLEGANKIYGESVFHGCLGYGSYISSKCRISAQIGRFTSIASHVQTICGTHPYKTPYVTTSPFFFSTNLTDHIETFATKQTFKEKRYWNETKKLHVCIGSDCWIGEGVVMIGGISIGDGAVILAKSVITKDVPPYAIVGGIPGKIIGYRYDEKTIKHLLDFKWWNMPKEWLKRNWNCFNNIEEFMKVISNQK